MSRVHVLPENVANQIAAGEVVERPASVVKELVENAVDAGARKIVVELAEGGRQITVTDDGTGMSTEDARTALQRFATSKIRQAEDLQDVASYGFRGEALPSIASISRLVLTSRLHDADEGVRIEVAGGEVLSESVAGCPAGTCIEVRDLFFNTPARAKFLKTEATEVRHALAAVSRLALVADHVGFEVRESGKQALSIPPEATAVERLGALHGSEVARQLHPFDREGHQVHVSGFVGAPALARGSSDRLYVYVNDRFVSDRTVASALREAYRSLLAKGRSPTALVRVTVPAHAVDVNVHPAKHEVRFTHSRDVWRTVYKAASSALEEAPWASALSSSWRRSAPISTRRAHPQAGALPSVAEPAQPRLEKRPVPRDETAVDEAPVIRDDRPFQFTDLRVLGQFGATCLLCELDGDLLVMDQHAAHERVMFERLRAARREEQRPASQRLLVPDMLELAPGENGLLEEAQPRLEALGFELSPFGGTTWAIHAVPAMLARASAQSLVADAVAELGESDTSRSLEDRMEALLARMACHSAIRAGDSVSPVEARQLLEDLDAVPYAANCPHGRPVLVRVSRDEIEKWFGRDYCG